jgi:acetyl esterase/lipase
MPSRTINYIRDPNGSIAAPAAMLSRRIEMDRRGLPIPENVEVVAHPAGPGKSEWVKPSSGDTDGVTFYIHGSGYSKGSPASHRQLVARIVTETGWQAFVLDYRLAPEHRFPAAHDDALTAYRSLLQKADPNAIAVVGDSAGGGLALAMLIAARDEGLPMPAVAATLSAWTDLAVSGRPRPDVDDPLVTADMLKVAADIYLDGADPHDPYASPLYGDLTGLPPLLMQVGGREIMIEDTERLANRASAAGVSARTSVYPGMSHVFQLNAPDGPDAARATTELAQFLKAHVRH